MFSIFRKNKLDLSTPSNFEKSIRRYSGSLNSLFSHNTWQEIAKKQKPREYMEVIESLALSGNSDCQELVTQWNIMTCEKADKPETLKFCLRKAIRFGELAAQSGVLREAINLPISMMRLAEILVEESDGYLTEEIEKLFKSTYHWSILNSKNLQIPKDERESAGQLAQELHEGSPELFQSNSAKYENESQDELVSLAERCAKEICSEFKDINVIFQLILEDIEGASTGNEKAKKFARTSGISPSQYSGALNNSRPEVDGPKGAKTYLDEMALVFYPDLDKVAEFRLTATDYIMRHHRLGKYASKA